jgi:uncharacterized protein (TIGR03083 family)
MVLSRAEVLQGLDDELARFEELVRALDATEWSQPSRCAGWTAGDLAAHVTGTFADVVAGRLEGLGTPEVTEREVAERRGHSPAELADELRQVRKLVADTAGAFDDDGWNADAGAGLGMTVGEGVESLWYDTYLHILDIRAAVGKEAFTGPGLRASVSHVAAVLDRQQHAPLTLAFDGMEEFTVGGGGKRIAGDALAFVLAATGRADPALLGLDASVNIYR